jgi:Carbohydrate-binding module 48 (Isoamylase N-terminal domain)/Alpha amylase, catalytic domain
VSSALPSRLERGSPYPLGATWDGLGTNFAVFSAHAERIELCLFDPSGRREIARLPLPECTDEVWHGYLPNARSGLIYGYRAHGPYNPQDGHRFNPHKLLLDPYVKRFAGSLRWSDALFGYRINSPRGDLSLDRRDSAQGMLKAVVTEDMFDWGDDRPPNIPWSSTVIYEAHLRGMSMLRHDIRANERGTFAALGDPEMINYLRSLGITTLELLPIHAFVQDRVLIERGLRNYWGYNSIGFFAIEPRYLSDSSRNEMRVAVRRLHAAGIEVILDVVYNHTAEGSELGPTLSFRGLDNASYYRLVPDNRRHCINDTGTGNTLNLSHPRVLQLVTDSLRYWVTSFHVDGFRFDLGVTLGREEHGFDSGSGFFDALRQDPVLTRVNSATTRPASPSGTIASATAHAASGAAITASVPSLPLASPARAIFSTGMPAVPGPQSTTPLHTTASRSLTWSALPNVTTRRTAKTTKTATVRTIPPIGELKDRPRINRSWKPGRAFTEPCWQRFSLLTVRQCSLAATNSDDPRPVITMPIARITRSPGGTGTSRIRKQVATCEDLSRASSRCASSMKRCISGIFFTAIASQRQVSSTSPGSRRVANSFRRIRGKNQRFACWHCGAPPATTTARFRC